MFRYIFVGSALAGEVVIFERTDKNDLIERQVRTYFCTPLLDMYVTWFHHALHASVIADIPPGEGDAEGGA